MNKKLPVSLLFLFLFGLSFSQTENGIIYFYRQPDYIGSAVRMKIMVDDVSVVRLANGSLYKHEITPGEHYVSCQMSQVSRIKLTIEPGRKYYVKCYLNQGFWAMTPVVELSDSASGKAVVEGSALKTQFYEPVSNVKTKSRFGIVMGGGAGFNKIYMGYTEDNEDLTLSTGGGFFGGIGYGYQASKYFDLSFDLFYESSSLTPAVKNADASFNRLGILFTPAVVIPVKGGDYFRFRLGAGPGYYSGNKMKIEGSDAGSSDVTLKYESAFGMHCSLVFESNFSDRGSFSLGLKYYNVKYKFDPSGSTGAGEGVDFNSPDGSGLDFSLGYFYHF